MPTRRSPYSDRLLAYRDLVLSDGHELRNRGDWGTFFGNRIGETFDGRIILDIGCHDASLLSAAASAHPTSAFIGIDWTPRHLFHAAQRVRAAGLVNICLLHARAEQIDRIVAPGELDEIWLFHPEPHDLPKLLFAEPFLLETAIALTPAGLLCLKTDHPGYFQHALALMGLPEPEEFTSARAGQGPRMKTKELVEHSTLPQASQAVSSRFVVTAHSADFWNDVSIQSHAAARAFAGHTSTYEQRFRTKRLPIYYLELRPRAQDDAVRSVV